MTRETQNALDVGIEHLKIEIACMEDILSGRIEEGPGELRGKLEGYKAILTALQVQQVCELFALIEAGSGE